MNDIQFYNHKYPTVESLLGRTGKVNTALVRREWFPKLDIAKTIARDSSPLDIFGNVPLNDRIAFIVNRMKVEKCPYCGKEHIFFPRSARTYRLCNHKFNADRKLLSESKRKSHKRRKDDLITSLEDRTPMLDDAKFRSLVDRYFVMRSNFSFPITDETKGFFHDLIVRTIDILPLDKDSIELSQRLYLAKNGLTELPKCAYCDNTTSFRNRRFGYSKTCEEHSRLHAAAVRSSNNIADLSSSIDSGKYEIVSLPEVMTRDKLVIRCRKCGRESSWEVRNGMLGHISEKFLCRHCEVNHSRAETDLMEYIRSIYDGEIVFKTGSRKIIPPYEIDVYLPERKLAIEYDGIFWHCESNGKPRSYHLKKTEMCESMGIQLIHVFENEWIEKGDIVRSRLRDLLGIYDRTIYARKCGIGEVDPGTARVFLEENHIQGGCNSSVRLGLFLDGELISLMTFSKPRFRKNGPEWELVRFCNKLGCHVPGGASKLLKHFERTMRPKGIISYADRRWSTGKMYRTLGFNLISKSKPNYWYFVLSSQSFDLINRVSCQKHRLKGFLKKFDPDLSESENMRNNGYDRIFDCGNLVFVKK